MGPGYILITEVFYDSAVFKENVPSLIEETEIHLLAISSNNKDIFNYFSYYIIAFSCIEEQEAFILDRLECVREMSTEIQSSGNVHILDRLLFFFTGDKPVAQFERGTQRGGKFPCGLCGVHT